VVGRDVVFHLEERRPFEMRVEGVFQRHVADVWSLDEFVVDSLVWLDDVGFRAVVFLWKFEPRVFEIAEFVGKIPWVDNFACECRGGSDLWRTEVDVVVFDTGATLEVAVEGSQRDRVRAGHVADTDTRATRGLGEVHTGSHQFGSPALTGQQFRGLLGAGCDDHLRFHVDLAAFEHLRGREDVRVATVRTGTDDDLVDLFARDLADRDDVIRHRRLGDEWLQIRKVDRDLVCVLGVLVGFEFDVLVFATEPREPVLGLLVGREDTGGRAEFGPHVRDGRPLGNREGLDAWAGVLEDFADATFHREPSQHLEDDVFRGRPRGQFAFEANLDNFRHFDVVGTTTHGDGDVEATRADSQLAEAAGGRRV